MHSYKYWDFGELASFMAGFHVLYEGNIAILNLYAELEQPKDMYCITSSAQVIDTVLVAAMSFAGYFAFHDTVKDLIILNLPVSSGFSVLAKFAYLTTICGSTLMAFPIIFSYIETEDSVPGENDPTSKVVWYAFRRISIVYLIYVAG